MSLFKDYYRPQTIEECLELAAYYREKAAF